MKKRLAAILAACMVFACAAVSCGDDDDDDTSTKKKTSSSSASYEDNDDDADDDDDDDEEETTEKTTDEEEPATTAKKTTAKPDDEGGNETTTTRASSGGSVTGGGSVSAPETPVGGDLTGMWRYSEDDDETIYMDFSADGKGSVYADLTSIMFFEKDGSFYMEGMEFPKEDVSFDGKTIKVSMSSDFLGLEDDGNEDMAELLSSGVLVLERTGAADATTMDGEYRLAGGLFSSLLMEEYESNSDMAGMEMLCVIEGENLGLKLDNMFRYSTSGSELKIEGGGSDLFSDIEGESCQYSVSGDSLFIYVEDSDEVVEMTRTSSMW